MARVAPSWAGAKAAAELRRVVVMASFIFCWGVFGVGCCIKYELLWSSEKAKQAAKKCSGGGGVKFATDLALTQSKVYNNM